MIDSQIYAIAARNGWDVSVRFKGISLCFDFHWETLSGVPFSFTAEITDGKAENLVSEIVSFVDAIEPNICAKEWMIKSGVLASNRYLQAVADMEDIRTEAWLLACELSETISGMPLWVVIRSNGTNVSHFSVFALSLADPLSCRQSSRFRKT